MAQTLYVAAIAIKSKDALLTHMLRGQTQTFLTDDGQTFPRFTRTNGSAR